MTPRPELDAVPDPPRYWRDETSGLLAASVTRYLNGRRLNTRDIALIRAYLRQWVESSVWDMNPAHDDASRGELRRLRAAAKYALWSQADIRAWVVRALDAGIDPL